MRTIASAPPTVSLNPSAAQRSSASSPPSPSPPVAPPPAAAAAAAASAQSAIRPATARSRLWWARRDRSPSPSASAAPCASASCRGGGRQARRKCGQKKAEKVTSPSVAAPDPSKLTCPFLRTARASSSMWSASPPGKSGRREALRCHRSVMTLRSPRSAKDSGTWVGTAGGRGMREEYIVGAARARGLCIVRPSREGRKRMQQAGGVCVCLSVSDGQTLFCRCYAAGAEHRRIKTRRSRVSVGPFPRVSVRIRASGRASTDRTACRTRSRDFSSRSLPKGSPIKSAKRRTPARAARSSITAARSDELCWLRPRRSSATKHYEGSARGLINHRRASARSPNAYESLAAESSAPERTSGAVLRSIRGRRTENFASSSAEARP